ncbi:MAG TPA: type II CAAX endopeptidase family protein [Steroidobacteraceae bacterium]|jgi:membrane protease YdiL (CAAX protease family)|nr:type II CAAX endopeptidase family protein [Steroidobacteraceae bacterium]
MTEESSRGVWARMPVVIRAVIGGILVGMIAANIWPILLVALGMPVAAVAEVAFLALYTWWASGGGAPVRYRATRAYYFRVRPLSGMQWFWGCIAALSFAATIHAAIVLLFRFVPFPAAAFHRGYDFSFIASPQMQWLACVVSALSAAVCEETGFRGYMQRPIENRHGPVVAILISSLVFMLLHLTKDWALIGMVPIVFLGGFLLGLLAWASGTLVFGILGHWIMDIGLFAYWWTQIVGTFQQRPIFEAGVDPAFFVECAAFAAMLVLVLAATSRLRKLRML